MTFLNSFDVLKKMALKKGDFVELEFTGLLKEENLIFDTTSAEQAKKSGIFSKNMTYEPVVVCVGEQMVLRGLDEALEGKDVSSFSVDLPPEKAFGKKDSRLIQLIPKAKFIEQKINPVLGLQVNIDDVVGIVKNVTGGRVLVDFNHAFAGKVIHYEVKITRVVTDAKERLSALVKMLLKQNSPDVVVEGKKAIVALPVDLPAQVQEELNKRWASLVSVEEISFKKK